LWWYRGIAGIVNGPFETFELAEHAIKKRFAGIGKEPLGLTHKRGAKRYEK